VQGHAVGAGFQLALGCDLRIVADDVQLSIAEVTRGIVPDLGGTGRARRPASATSGRSSSASPVGACVRRRSGRARIALLAVAPR
jgi:hypothetical protein